MAGHPARRRPEDQGARHDRHHDQSHPGRRHLRRASGLLVLGTLATLALPVLPHSFERPLAVPTGVALIGLGISLGATSGKTAAITAGDLAPARVEHAAVR